MENSSPPAESRRLPSLGQVNLLLLVSLALILIVSLVAAEMNFYWSLAVREVCLVLGPALAFLLLLRLPWRETVRWRLPNWRVQIACVLVGVGGWLFDLWLGSLFGEILGYTLPLPPDFYPTTFGQALIMLVLLVIAAPVCEETLFRGLIQRGYEQFGVALSVLFTGLLFALFHQSLAQGLAIVPLAILLSYVAWRTDSLPAAMLVHAVNNLPAALLLPLSTLLPQLAEATQTPASTELSADLTARLSEISPAICTMPAALFGLLVAAGGLWGIHRWSPKPPALAERPFKPGVLRWVGRLAPLAVVALLAFSMMGLELLVGRYPEMLSMGRTLQWAALPEERSQTWTYEVRDGRNEAIGELTCTLEPDEVAYHLACRRQSAYEVQAEQGAVIANLDERLSARWRRDDLGLLIVEIERENVPGWRSFTVAPLDGGAGVDVEWTTQEGQVRSLQLPSLEPAWVTPLGELPLVSRGRTVARPPAVVSSAEWPWRFSSLPFQGVYSAQAALIDPRSQKEDGEPTLTRVSVLVYGAEPISTPAGTFVAWRVEVGPDHVAWYDEQAPHTLVAWEDGEEKWVLKSAD